MGRKTDREGNTHAEHRDTMETRQIRIHAHTREDESWGILILAVAWRPLIRERDTPGEEHTDSTPETGNTGSKGQER